MAYEALRDHEAALKDAVALQKLGGGGSLSAESMEEKVAALRDKLCDAAGRMILAETRARVTPLPYPCGHSSTSKPCHQQSGALPESSNVSVVVPKEIVVMMEESSLQSVEFFDSCRTVVTTTAQGHTSVINNIPRQTLSGLLEKLREQNVTIKSRLGKKLAGTTASHLLRESCELVLCD